MNDIIEKILMIISILFVLVTHEFAHAYIAYLNGDETAKDAGRMTLNPLKHLDIFGTICMILFRFGWAKPVPINNNNFNNRNFGLFSVSIAGIGINFLTAIISIFLLKHITITNYYIVAFLNYLVLYGILFAVFNLLPIPPLDGSNIVLSFLSPKFEYYVYKYERQFNFILIILIATGTISQIITPIIYNIYEFLFKIL